MNTRKFNSKIHEQYIKQGEVCFYCKEPTAFEKITRDHFKPKSAGYTLRDNTVFACGFCNSHKGSRNMYQFRERMCHILSDYLRSGKVFGRELNGQQRKIERFKRTITTCTELIKNDSDPSVYFP